MKNYGSLVTAMWNNQMYTWEETYLNSFGIAFEIHKNCGVQLLAHGVGLVLHQMLYTITDEEMKQRYLWWKPWLHKQLGEARGVDAHHVAWTQAVAAHEQQQQQQQQQPASPPAVYCPPQFDAASAPKCNPNYVVPGPPKPQV